MKKSMIAILFLLSLNVSASLFGNLADGFIDKFGTIEERVKARVIEPSTGCVELFEQRFTLDDSLVDSCNQIDSFIQFQCVQSIARHKSVYTGSISSCSAYEDEYSLSTLESYMLDYGNPKSETVLLFAAISSNKEKACVENIMKIGSFTLSNMEEKCIEDTDYELDEREFNAFGVVRGPRTIEFGAKTLKKGLESLWQSIF